MPMAIARVLAYADLVLAVHVCGWPPRADHSTAQLVFLGPFLRAQGESGAGWVLM